jgi:DNA-binding HxlR family transcriptional regulator
VVPPKVEYSLTKAGESLRPLIVAMQQWGDRYIIQSKAPLGPRCGPTAKKEQERLGS